MKIKVITYNIWHGKFLDKVIDFLRGEAADVICLQEATAEVFESLERALKLGGRYKRMFRGDEGEGEYELGNAVLTKFEMLETNEFNYEREMTEEILRGADEDRYNLPRLMLGQGLKVGSAGLWVFNTHHTITPNGEVTEHQLTATRQLKDFLKKYDRYILCGDMNTPYGNENYKLLSQGLSDWSGPPTPTLHPTIHKVGFKGYHVDYVFAKGQGMKHLATRIPVVAASDHLPVVVELEI